MSTRGFLRETEEFEESQLEALRMKPSVMVTPTNRVKLWHTSQAEREQDWGVVNRSSPSLCRRAAGCRRRAKLQQVQPIAEDATEKKVPTAGMVVTEVRAVGDIIPCDSSPRGGLGNKISVVEFAEAEICAFEASTGFHSEFTKTPMTFTVERRGFLESVVEVKWRTKNMTMIPRFYGDHGKDVAGVLRFEKDVETLTITLAFEDDPTHNVEATFWVVLIECKVVEGDEEAVLGHLSQASGCKLNTERFPKNVGPKADKLEIYFGFVFEMFWMMPWKTGLSIVYNTVPALCFYVHQMIMENAIITISRKEDYDHDRIRRRMELCALAYVGNWLVQHFALSLNERLKLYGRATRELRVQVVTQMIQLSPVAQENFDTGDIPNIMETQVSDAISNVFLTSLTMWGELCKFLVMIYIIFATLEGDPGRLAVILILFWSYATIIVWCTFDTQYLLSFSAMERDDNIAAFATMLETARQVVTNYSLGWAFARMFKELHLTASESGFKAGLFKLETKHALHWGTVLVGAYIFARASLPKGIDAAQFVVLFNAANGMGRAAEGIAASIQIVAIGLAAAEKVAQCLNAETRRVVTLRDKRPQAKTAATADCIVVSEAEMTNEHQEKGGISKSERIGPISVVLRPGILASLVDGGQQPLNGGAGKMSLLQMLNGEVIPSRGFVSLPRGHRTCLLPPFPIIFDGTLMFNLRIGRPTCTHAQVWSLCADLGLSSRLQGLAEYDLGTDGTKISLSDRAVVAIARALLSGREAFFIGGTLDILTPPRVAKVLAALRLFLTKRGLDHWIPDPVPHFLRKRRTFLIVTKSKQIADYTDTSLILDSGGEMSTSNQLAHWDTPTLETEATTPLGTTVRKFDNATGLTKNEDEDEDDEHNEEGSFQGGATESFLPPIERR